MRVQQHGAEEETQCGVEWWRYSDSAHGGDDNDYRHETTKTIMTRCDERRAKNNEAGRLARLINSYLISSTQISRKSESQIPESNVGY